MASTPAVEKYTSLEVQHINCYEHIYAKKDRDKAIEKRRENQLLHRQVLRNPHKINHLGFPMSFSEVLNHPSPISSLNEQKPICENFKFLSRCIKENLGFKNGKPIAACIIHKCLRQWHAFESDNTSIFNHIIEAINYVLKVRKDHHGIVWSYWLSNTSTLLRLLHSNGIDKGLSQVEARHPAILFKQQLTACVEKIFGLLRDNLKKEVSQLLELHIQTAKRLRVHGGKSSGILWSSIVKLLDSFLSKLRGNHVSSFFIRKIVTQVFSFINITLFNSLLLHPECCTLSNGKYMESGLAELDKWMANAKELYAGTSWLELNYTRQAVGFLVTHQKEKKSLEEIQVLCPALSVRQIYQISTTYWDAKCGTQSVSNEVLSIMGAVKILNDEIQNSWSSNYFLLYEDLSIPFTAEDVEMAIPPIDLDEIDLV